MIVFSILQLYQPYALLPCQRTPILLVQVASLLLVQVVSLFLSAANYCIESIEFETLPIHTAVGGSKQCEASGVHFVLFNPPEPKHDIIRLDRVSCKA